MGYTDINNYLLDPLKFLAPDEGLGDFIVGYTEENAPYNKKFILWNLFPIAGQLFFIFSLIDHFILTKSRAKRILIYKCGFIKQSLTRKGEIKAQEVFNFNDLNGVLYRKTRNYQNIYGITKYAQTTVSLQVLDSNNIKEEILAGLYRNEDEVADKYNFIGYACKNVNDAWFNFALQRFNSQFSKLGYGTFWTEGGEIRVGKEYISVNGFYVTSGFKYSFNNGHLYLYPNAAESSHFKYQSKPISINVAEMFNKEVFLLAIQQIHGIK